MSFHAPSPGTLSLWISEQAEVVKLGVANRTTPFLDIAQDVFQAHYRGGFCESLLIKVAAEQRVGKLPTGLVQVLEGNPLAGPWNIVPVKPLVVFELESG